MFTAFLMPRCQNQVTKKAPALKPGQWKIEGPIMIDFISSQGLQPQTHQGNMKGGRRHVADELVLKFALCCDYNITILLRMSCVSEKELHRDISSGTWSMSGAIIASGELASGISWPVNAVQGLAEAGRCPKRAPITAYATRMEESHGRAWDGLARVIPLRWGKVRLKHLG